MPVRAVQLRLEAEAREREEEQVSFLSKAWKSVRSVAAPVIGTAIGGPAGGIIATALAGSSGRSNLMPQVQPVMGALPALGQLGRMALPGVAGAVGGAVVRGAGAAMRGAINLCRKHPQWCSTIGGTAAVAAMIESGQIPAPRRRRGRGISGRDLRAYRRVHGILADFCTPKARIKKVCR